MLKKGNLVLQDSTPECETSSPTCDTRESECHECKWGGDSSGKTERIVEEVNAGY